MPAGGLLKRLPVKTSAAAATEGEQHEAERCPRCDSIDTKFCYYNNYNTSQPRHFCRSCRRYWTLGGSLRNVPIGGSSRKRPRPLSPSPALGTAAKSMRHLPAAIVSSHGYNVNYGAFLSNSLHGGLFGGLSGGGGEQQPFELGLGLGLGLGAAEEHCGGGGGLEEMGFGTSAAPGIVWPSSTLLEEEEQFGDAATVGREFFAAGGWPDLAFSSAMATTGGVPGTGFL